MDETRRPLRVILHPSRTLAFALLTGYSGAALCLLSLDLGSGISSLMFALLTLSGYCDIRTHFGRNPRRAREIVLHCDDDWRVIDAGGNLRRGRPLGALVVHSVAVCFSIRTDCGQRVPVLVLKDMCTSDTFRRLRVWLNMNGASRTQSAFKRRAGLPIARTDGFRS